MIFAFAHDRNFKQSVCCAMQERGHTDTDSLLVLAKFNRKVSTENLS